jgi:hypothetical protein
MRFWYFLISYQVSLWRKSCDSTELPRLNLRHSWTILDFEFSANLDFGGNVIYELYGVVARIERTSFDDGRIFLR